MNLFVRFLEEPPGHAQEKWKEVDDGIDLIVKNEHKSYTYTNKMTDIQGSATRYLLRVVTVLLVLVVTTVTSFTIVPKSSDSGSTC